MTDDAIIDAVRKALAERGASFTVAEVARTLGVSQAALMKRVGGRAALVALAVAGDLRPSGLAVLETVPRIDQERLLATHLEAMLGLLLDEVRVDVPNLVWLRAFKVPLAQAYLFHEGPSFLKKRKLTQWFRGLQRAGQLQGLEPEPLAEMVYGLVEARVFREHVLGEPATPEATQAWCKQTLRHLFG